MTPSLLFLGLVFGSIGTGYLVYGKRQGAMVPFIAGLLLMIVPYLVSDAIGLTIVGLLIAAAPFVLKD